jgi:deoxyinosine 3'endonuclease (endonuclease V)
MEGQLKVWIEEQLEIASRVIKYPDDDSEFEEEEYNGEDGVIVRSPEESVRYKYMTYSTKPEDAKFFGGVDISFGQNDLAIAVYVITKDESIVYQDSIEFQLTVPYVSSFLAFREIEPLTELVLRQKQSKPEFTPHAILVDGNGIFHIRGAGIASFLGVKTNMRTIGVGKTLYCMDGLDHSLVQADLEAKVNDFLAMKGNNENNDGNGVDYVKDIGIAILTNDAIQPENTINSLPLPPFGQNVSGLAQYCNGFAVPIKGRGGSTLGAALIGHGGKIGSRAASGKAMKGGTKIPIFVSIGHKISLQRAIQICASISYAR